MLRAVYSSSLAATLAIIVTTVITVWGELSPPLKDGLKDFSGHHWTTKSILVIAAYVLGFILVYVLRRNVAAQSVQRSLLALISST
ncbi:MAG: hypothetical protein HY460_02120, partial [Parcubacteria group bacterium]|nr:hypothetical protein [Parcubacteria group bacterium]